MGEIAKRSLSFVEYEVKLFMSDVDKVISYISKELERDLTLEDLLIIGITYYFAYDNGKGSVSKINIVGDEKFKDDPKIEA